MNTRKLKNLAMNENGFAFDPTTGYSYNLNDVGMYVVMLLQQDKTREDILQIMKEEYDVEPERLESDIDFFLLQLSNLGLAGVYDGRLA